MSGVINVRFQVAGHTAAEWAAISTIPLEREVCVETDTRLLKVGDGVNAYGALPYVDVATLGGHAAAYFLDRANHTGTQTSSTISDFAEAAQDVVGAMVSNGANITATYDDTANTLTIAVTGTLPAARMPAFTGGDVTSSAGSAVLTLATVNASPGSFGAAGKTITATIDAKGRATVFAETAIAITASQVTDFSEATDDRVAALLTAGTNIGLSYDDAGNALTISLINSPALAGTPTAPTAANVTSNTQVATTAFVHAVVSDVINAAPAALDTLKELADAIGDDANYAATVTTNLATKLSKASNLSDLANAGTARANLGVAIGTDVQAYNANLAAISGLTTAADKMLYWTGAGTAALLSVSSANRSGLSNLSGTNTGDQTITLTGDVTGSGTGSFSATIAAGAVTLAKQANMATASVVYRKTAGAGAPEVQTLATLKTDLGLTGTNSGDQTITLTGDVTGSGTGSFAATIASASVTLAKMANLAANSFIGNNTGSAATPIALTVAQAKTLLAISASDVSGLGTMATQSAASVAITGGSISQAVAATALTLATGWSQFNAAYESAGYLKTLNGLVMLRGTVTGSGSAAALIGTLPAGCRPAKKRLFQVWNGGNIGCVIIYADGSVSLDIGSTTNNVQLDGIIFDV